jgi:heme/copper-type cytochrome/quinol oxidase subunit 2
MVPYLIIAGILCIAALIGTVMVGINPKDEQYEQKTKKHITNMSIIYFVTFVPALILTVVFFVYR